MEKNYDFPIVYLFFINSTNIYSVSATWPSTVPHTEKAGVKKMVPALIKLTVWLRQTDRKQITEIHLLV